MILLCTKDCKHKHIYVLLFIHYFCCACLQIYVHVCVWLCKTQPHLIDSTRHSSEYYWDLLYIHSTLYVVLQSLFLKVKEETMANEELSSLD